MKEISDSLDAFVFIGFLAIGVFALIEFYYRAQFKKHL